MEHTVSAHNDAVASDNKIHDDAVARLHGFRGGLVPGVTVFAYMVHVPAATWGLDWLTAGTMHARFGAPVYEGEDVTVRGTLAADALDLALTGPDGVVRATGGATSPGGGATALDLDGYREAPLPSVRPPVSAEALAATGGALGSLEFGFHAGAAGGYLDGIGETAKVFLDEGVAHPGWLLRSANYLLSSNVGLGPWIHVSSACTNLGVVRDGQRVTTRGRVRETFERKGHAFVALDVLISADGAPAMHVDHTAIWRIATPPTT